MDNNNPELCQYFTPAWAAHELMDHYFGDLGIWDKVLEPSCGPGSFLAAVPDHVPAVGVEIDPVLVERARAHTGREVILGDFLTAEIPFTPTAVIGNPPFKQKLMQGFIDRAWELLPDEGRCGFLLPVFALQTPSVVERLAQRWHVRQDLVPRTVFPRLSTPLLFAMLTKGPKRGLVGFTLYHETFAVSRLQARYRALLARGEAGTWRAVVNLALDSLGGRATLAQIYAEVEGIRPSANKFWREKVRQVLQRHAVRSGPGEWQLAST